MFYQAIFGLFFLTALTYGQAINIPFSKQPGESFKGELPKLTDEQKSLASNLKTHVEKLASDIGFRNIENPKGLEQTIGYLTKTMNEFGLELKAQTYPLNGIDCRNLIAEIKGTEKPGEIVIIGAHYDSVHGSPAANDNASGVAAVIEIARAFQEIKPMRTIRFVFFVNEEPLNFQRESMGSLVYAKSCAEKKEKIIAMMSLETIGYYSDEPGSQKYPPPFDQYFPSVGNFVAIVGNIQSESLVNSVTTSFRKHTQFPSEGIAAPGEIRGIGFSDHWSFWQCGYPAIMITDTAMFRYPNYHKSSDTPDKIDFSKTARVVEGIEKLVHDLLEK